MLQEAHSLAFMGRNFCFSILFFLSLTFSPIPRYSGIILGLLPLELAVMSQMQRSFALWPETIWAEITSRLTPRDTFILTAVVGDKTLRHKLINGGVTTMSYKSSSAEKIVISLLPHFRALYRLSMEASPYSPDFNLRLLPPTLRELSIRAHCSTWLDAKCDDSTFLEDPRNAWYHTDGKCAFEFHTHLPNLDHLHLECTHAEPAHKTDPKLNVFGRILMLGVRCLPAKLKSLALSHLTLIYVQLWKYLNIQSLDRLELLDVANPDFLELVRQHAPWAPLLHATLSTSAKSLQGFTFPKNIRAITLRGWQEELSFGGPFTEYFGDLSLLKDLFPLSSSAQTDTNASKNSSTPFPTLDTLVVGYDSTTMNSQVFLPARKTLWIISYGPTDASISIETSFSTLTELRCDVPVAEETLVALTNLTTLSYQSGTASITKSFFDSLSPTLKTLELVAAGFVEEISGWLPRGLTSYSQRIVKPSEMPTGRGVAVIVIKRELNFLSPKFFKSLPPNLTSLSSPDNACEDFVYSSSAPKSLKYLNLSTIYFTGRSLEQGRRYFDQRNEFSAPPYRPGHDSPYKGPLEKSEAWVQRFLLSKDQPIVGNSPCHYSMGLRIQALPSSLTTLKLGDASSSHYTQTVILDMPHLTRMSLAHWHHWNWRSNTPSLTRLSVRDCDYTPHFQREYPEDDSSSANLFPPSLTRLHLSAISGYSNLKPVMPPYGLANQIKHLVLASSYLYSASSQREVYDSFKVLETIELATYQQGWEYLPKTLTSITYKSESPLPHSVTNLMRLFPKLRSLNITSASPITTDKELEQICESTRSSNAQNPSQNMPLDLLVLDYMVINDLSAYLRAPELHEKEILISGTSPAEQSERFIL